MSDVTSRLFVSDLNLLLKVYKRPVMITKKISYKIERLNSLGVLTKILTARVIDGGLAGSKESPHIQELNGDEWYAKITGLGNDFCINGLYPLE